MKFAVIRTEQNRTETLLTCTTFVHL